jgi:hypothetical protein
MKLRASLCVFAALLIWANVSHACDSTHEPQPSLNLIQQERQAQIAAETAAYVLAIEAELAADADRGAEFASSGGVLLLDHEGESLALLTASEMVASAQLLDESVVGQSVDPSLPSQADAPVRRFLLVDEDPATFSQIDEQRSEPEATGSTVMHLHVSEMVLDGYEDR